MSWTKSQAIEIVRLIDSLQKLTDVDKIITTFIPAFKNKVVHHDDGTTTLHGSFNLGGTRSGRQSANNPNLQQIPSTGTPYAKPIKRCFKAPPGWIFCGADFLSLEDRISALTTQDENKIQVYTQGYDGHCLRAHAYFSDQMPDLVYDLAKVDIPGKLFRVTHNDGTEEYFHETDPEFQELQRNS
jgi:DNA polymerase-1